MENKTLTFLWYIDQSLATLTKLLARFNQELMIPSRCLALESTNIYKALAVETTLFESVANKCVNSKFNFPLLLFWTSSPSIVIGRHQNPWLECNMNLVNNKGLKFARRASGGGTVYHDFGNLNISFMTPRENYNKENSMELVKTSINKLSNIKCFVGKRGDLYINDNLKISGSSSRLLRDRAYIHCTCLYNADIISMESYLQSVLNIETNATQSIRSSVGNIKLDPKELMREISNDFCAQNSIQNNPIIYIEEGREYKFMDQTLFRKHFENYSSYDWIFGSTPNFKISNNKAEDGIELSIGCKKGKINEILIEPITDQLNGNLLELISNNFIGQNLVSDILLKKLDDSFTSLELNDKSGDFSKIYKVFYKIFSNL